MKMDHIRPYGHNPPPRDCHFHNTQEKLRGPYVQQRTAVG